MVEVYFNLIGLKGKLCGALGTKSLGPKNCRSALLTPLVNLGLSIFEAFFELFGVVQGFEVVLGFEVCFDAEFFLFHSFCLIFLTVFRCSSNSWDKGLSPPNKNESGGGGLRFGGRGLDLGFFVVVVVVVVVLGLCLSK